MKYRVIGTNRTTGARMTLEMEAESKAAAERKAAGQGMTVSRVEDVSDGPAGHVGFERGTSSRRLARMHPVLRLAILVAAIAAGYYLLWPMIRGVIPQ